MSARDIATGPTAPRQTYLGASDIAAVIGLSPYRTALDVWAEKVRGVETRDNEPMAIGRALERPVLETLYAPPRSLALHYPGTVRHPSEPWMGATPDALAGRVAAPDRVAECKIVGRRQMKRWGDPESGADGIPPEVLAQATWQLATWNALGLETIDAADIVALLGTELRVYGVAYDPEFAADLMEAGRSWWRRHVEGGVMPEVYEGARAVLARAFSKPAEGVLLMREDVRELARAYLAAQREYDTAKSAKEKLAASLCALIGDASGFEAPGLRVTWLPRKGSVSYKAIVDALGVPESDREAYRGEPTRVLRVVGDGEDA